MASAANLDAIEEKIARTSAESDRSPDGVKLIAVSKTYSADDILPLLEAGHRVFGENRVQEAQAKWPELKEQYPDIELHLIGPLQSNKAADAVALFDVIHTIDRLKIAKALAKEMQAQSRAPQLLVQVNTGEEEQKAGISPGEAVSFVAECRETHGLKIQGLMAIPPFDENPGPHFALLRKLAKKCDVAELSMGMSGDFETAIAFGATMVRVGSAIFGARS